MTVYNMHFAGMGTNKIVSPYNKAGLLEAPHLYVNEFVCLKMALENTSDTFLFIITAGEQELLWNHASIRYGYKKHTLFEMPYFVRNHNYVEPEYGRRLKLIILKGSGKDD